ncbi:Heme chaperone HemW [Buchnera aphidicola (Sipha maydis)]|nr:radical SAM family heme chaperone HemW [Buchnera aphidicola]USS94104.1 radical SAM family heme chaperone HemW [Buchnera aphidicola (Sipha maydis)]WII23651.1 radical SAM family heme chaperone HemW [Buchnera aphidicola (Sipha maydis)]
MKIPLSLYIHIPWCLTKCPYCDFYSKSTKKKIPEKKYITNLLLDLQNDIKLINSRKIRSIFIGGGTPNLIHPKYIKYLIQEIKKKIFFAKNIEITLEANPKSIHENVFFQYKEAGVNRLSLGIQSFHETLLKKIHRKYSFIELIKTIKYIRKKKFTNINFDLMYGLPQQTIQESLQDLLYAIKYNPSHISWYQLSIEKNTPFSTKKIILPHEKKILLMEKKGKKILKKNKFVQYEISSYTKNKKKCQHNLNYWNFGDYLGIGCGAHGKITLKNRKILRTIKNKNINKFLNGEYIQKQYIVKKKNIAFEFFLNNFRLHAPCFKKKFTQYTGLKIESIKSNIYKAIKKKYIIENNDSWETTNQGKCFLNNLLQIFLE